MSDQRNVLVAIVISIMILVGWNYFIEAPKQEQRQQAQQQQQQQNQAGQIGQPGGQQLTPTLPDGTPAPMIPVGPGPNLDAAGVATPAPDAMQSRAAALSQTPRVRVDSPRVRGSISLQGARIDDLVLKDYRETLDPDSANIVLLHPTKGDTPYYASFGWIGPKEIVLPSFDTVWQASGSVLSAQSPVTLSWDNGAGLLFEQIFSIDENYMIRNVQRVRNSTGTPVTLTPFGLISRTGTPNIEGFFILHEGPIGVLDEILHEIDYEDLRDKGAQQFDVTSGWLGITDKYWLVALIPDNSGPVKVRYIADMKGPRPLYQTDYVSAAQTVPAGGSTETSSHLFAGAKEVRLLDKYEAEQGIYDFDKAVDFGWLYYLTKPIFYAIDWLYGHLGNFGLAILALTVFVKLLFFPLANKSYVSMSKMKLLQPRLLELREKYGDDRAKLNQEMMALYKKEGANPAAGCLPILVQIPVFFALYKVLFVNIEMRHAPFFGWIHDLSAPDPAGILTGFGFFPWDVPAVLTLANIGIWPLIMGLTMYLQQKLNPAPTDPVQAKVFMFMPLIFMFMLAGFPAGLVIYWAWNNTLSIAQQYVIMRRQGVAIGGGSTKGKTS
ncbi:MAG: membrane protein insertase YidC [Alphaproteobacteria bacterium]